MYISLSIYIERERYCAVNSGTFSPSTSPGWKLLLVRTTFAVICFFVFFGHALYETSLRRQIGVCTLCVVFTIVLCYLVV